METSNTFAKHEHARAIRVVAKEIDSADDNEKKKCGARLLIKRPGTVLDQNMKWGIL